MAPIPEIEFNPMDFRINPPYKDIEKQKKTEMGYLTCKRAAIMILKYAQLKKLFNFRNLRVSFQWFDKENLLDTFNTLRNNYQYEGEVDFELYSLADFITFFINYSPEFFAQVITQGISEMKLDPTSIEILNDIFAPLGYIYENNFFYSSSFSPKERARMNDLIGEKLKVINPDLYTTWNSVTEEMLSNNTDKATNISAKSRKLISSLLRELTPELKFESGETDQIKKRLSLILPADERSAKIIDRVSNLINALNKSQAKGDHEFIDEDAAIFAFHITETIVFFILKYLKK